MKLSEAFKLMKAAGHTEQHPLQSNPFVNDATIIEDADDGMTMDDIVIQAPGTQRTSPSYTIRLFDKGCFSSFGVRLALEDSYGTDGPLPDGLFRGIPRPARWKDCMHKRESAATKCMVCAAFGRLTVK